MNPYNNKPLVLFYSNTPRAFRTTLIGHLYEISQVWPVILLSEELDSNMSTIIRDKNFFPNLKKIISVYQHTGPKKNLFSKNRYLYKLAKSIIRNYKPDIVVASSDWYPLFELYLMKFAKKINALRVTFQDTFTAETEKTGIWIDLINLHCKTPVCFPFWFRISLIKLRKYIGHILIYWVLPLLNGEPPFFGKQSYILHKGHSGSRDSNYHVVLSARDNEMYKKSGVPPDKLYIHPHPLTRQASKIFAKLVSLENKEIREKGCKIAVVMLPAEEIGFSRTDYSLIKRETRIKVQNEVFKILLESLEGWKIIVKPHPVTRNYLVKKKQIESISTRIEVVNPGEPADKYIELGDIIIELPRAASTTLTIASLWHPEKPILALDLHHEFLGDCYKSFNGVEYIDNLEGIKSTLEKIRNNKYVKTIKDTDTPNGNYFSGTVELLEYLMRKGSFSLNKKQEPKKIDS